MSYRTEADKAMAGIRTALDLLYAAAVNFDKAAGIGRERPIHTIEVDHALLSGTLQMTAPAGQIVLVAWSK